MADSGDRTENERLKERTERKVRYRTPKHEILPDERGNMSMSYSDTRSTNIHVAMWT